MLLVRFLTITVKFITDHDCPMLFVSISFSLQIALAFECLPFIRIILSESLKRLDLVRLINFLRLIMFWYALVLLIGNLFEKSFICRLIELSIIARLDLQVYAAGLFCRWGIRPIVLVLWLHETTADIFTPVTHTDSKCFVRVNRGEVSFKFNLHVFLIWITDCDWLFRLFINSQLMASRYFMRTFWSNALQVRIRNRC